MKWYKKIWCKIKVVALNTYETSKEVLLMFLLKMKPIVLKELSKISKSVVEEIKNNKANLLNSEKREYALNKIKELVKLNSKTAGESLKDSAINLLIEISVAESKK